MRLSTLNVVIGPNGAGKSNLLEAFALLSAVPSSLQACIREGGTAADWIWKGEPRCSKAILELEVQRSQKSTAAYELTLGLSGQRLDISEEHFRQVPASEAGVPFGYFDIEGKTAKVATKFIGSDGPSDTYETHTIDRQFVKSDESIIAQRRDPLAYPDLTELADVLSRIYVSTTWTFGKYAPLRSPVPTTHPNDTLLPDGSNLALYLNYLEHEDFAAYDHLKEWLRRLLPRFQRLSTPVFAGTTQLYLHESGATTPIPAQRLSDGTLRFITLAAALLAPRAPSIVCIDEPDLGLHPDAMALLADLLKEASERTQIIVTTHSEAFLSQLSDSPESVLVCERRGDSTILERLEAEKLAFWLEKYSLGEIWRAGKLGGNP